MTNITIDQLDKRVEDEILKFNRGSTIESVSKSSEDAVESLTQYFPSNFYPLIISYITPISISTIANSIDLCAGIDCDPWVYNNVLVDIIRYRSRLHGGHPACPLEGDPFHVKPDPPKSAGPTISQKGLPEYEQKYRNGLLDVFDHLGCVVPDIRCFANPHSLPSNRSDSSTRDPHDSLGLRNMNETVDSLPEAFSSYTRSNNLDFTATENINPIDFSDEDILSEQYSPGTDEGAPQEILWRILREKVKKKGCDPVIYQLFTESGKLNLCCPSTDEKTTPQEFVWLPPQVRILHTFFSQLFLAKSGISCESTIRVKRLFDLFMPKPENQAYIIPDTNSFGAAYFNFLDIMELQYLAGFQKSDPKNKRDKQRVFIKKRVWKKLHEAPLDDLRNNSINKLALCRTKRYINKKIHGDLELGASSGFDFPVYNECFFLGPGAGAKGVFAGGGMEAVSIPGIPTKPPTVNDHNQADSVLQKTLDQVASMVAQMTNGADTETKAMQAAIDALLEMQTGSNKNVSDLIDALFKKQEEEANNAASEDGLVVVNEGAGTGGLADADDLSGTDITLLGGEKSAEDCPPGFYWNGSTCIGSLSAANDQKNKTKGSKKAKKDLGVTDEKGEGTTWQIVSDCPEAGQIFYGYDPKGKKLCMTPAEYAAYLVPKKSVSAQAGSQPSVTAAGCIKCRGEEKSGGKWLGLAGFSKITTSDLRERHRLVFHGPEISNSAKFDYSTTFTGLKGVFQDYYLHGYGKEEQESGKKTSWPNWWSKKLGQSLKWDHLLQSSVDWGAKTVNDCVEVSFGAGSVTGDFWGYYSHEAYGTSGTQCIPFASSCDWIWARHIEKLNKYIQFVGGATGTQAALVMKNNILKWEEQFDNYASAKASGAAWLTGKADDFGYSGPSDFADCDCWDEEGYPCSPPNEVQFG